MKRIHISEASSGDALASPIYGKAGKVLLAEGTKLTGPYISSLIKKGIEYLYIHTKNTDGIVPPRILHSQVRQEAVLKVYETMTSLYNERALLRATSSQDIGKEFEKVFKEILNHLFSSHDHVFNLSDLFISEGYFFHHSVNVAILAGIVGIARGYSENQLLELGVGALLFDIGMTQIPSKMWNKKSYITVEEKSLIQQHTITGYNILKKQDNVSEGSAFCALQHHERFDQSGYPLKLKSDQVHEYAKIVGIADVYDALTANRSHRKSYSSLEAAEYLSAAGGILFDLDIIRDFLRCIAIYPIATRVLLSNGFEAVVSQIHPELPLRPTVRVIKNPKGEELKSPFEMDLRTKFTVMIEKTI
ncbi:HD-GYP domain-containing protein [Peribacillus acanthi]|uniref:HD-GYP domain-containing protein n=1 Tax=Peribacillus acanthi TaxID=2171554 RepID=UPI000D3EC448|nr:HD-GYP domain-containing protein [Peribacillus acanthi]